MAQTKAQLLNPLNGNINVSGIITANSGLRVGTVSAGATVGPTGSGIVTYYGDGSQLTGITAGATLSAGSGSQRVVLTSLNSGTMTSAATDAELTYNSGTNTLSATTFSGNATGLTGTPDITVQDITAETISVGGTLTYEDVSNVDSVGLVTARTGIRIGTVGTGGTVGPAGSGIVTYYGDGSQLTGISIGLNTSAATPSNAVVTLNLSSAQDHKVTATGIVTVTCSGGTEGESHTVRIINSGAATVGFSTYFLFPSGSSPSMPASSGSISLISFTVNRVGTAGTQLLAGASVNFS